MFGRAFNATHAGAARTARLLLVVVFLPLNSGAVDPLRLDFRFILGLLFLPLGRGTVECLGLAYRFILGLLFLPLDRGTVECLGLDFRFILGLLFLPLNRGTVECLGLAYRFILRLLFLPLNCGTVECLSLAYRFFLLLLFLPLHSRIWHPHHLVGNSVRFLLIHIIRCSDLQLCLYTRDRWSVLSGTGQDPVNTEERPSEEIVCPSCRE
jgi:hypothetical protein